MEIFKEPLEDDISHYEELRRRNLEDNKVVLAKLMSGVAEHLSVKPIIPQKKRKSPKLIPEDMAIRRNPSRSARLASSRFDLPRRRSRSGSVSSSSSTSTPLSTPEKLVVKFGFFRKMSETSSLGPNAEDEDVDGMFETDDDVPLPKQTRKSRTRHEIIQPEDITQADLDMVSVVVSDKRYDSILGSSCHQCRQKTNDMKTICRSPDCIGIRGQFCGPCLRNRYGEDAKVALKDSDWICPPCRGICNCSFCRKKKGRASTGILIHVARENGYSDVNSYLKGSKKES